MSQLTRIQPFSLSALSGALVLALLSPAAGAADNILAAGGSVNTNYMKCIEKMNMSSQEYETCLNTNPPGVESQSTDIALGKGATVVADKYHGEAFFVRNMPGAIRIIHEDVAGSTGYFFSDGPAYVDGVRHTWGLSTEDAARALPGGIAIGSLAFANQGGITIGAHTEPFFGTALPVAAPTISSTRPLEVHQNTVYGSASTVIGANSYSKGDFLSVLGSYNNIGNMVALDNFSGSTFDGAGNVTQSTQMRASNLLTLVSGTFNEHPNTKGVALPYLDLSTVVIGSANYFFNAGETSILGSGEPVTPALLESIRIEETVENQLRALAAHISPLEGELIALTGVFRSVHLSRARLTAMLNAENPAREWSRFARHSQYSGVYCPPQQLFPAEDGMPVAGYMLSSTTSSAVPNGIPVFDTRTPDGRRVEVTPAAWKLFYPDRENATVIAADLVNFMTVLPRAYFGIPVDDLYREIGPFSAEEFRRLSEMADSLVNARNDCLA